MNVSTPLHLHHDDRPDDHHEDEGLAADLPLLLRRPDQMSVEPERPRESFGRRRFLQFAGGAGAVTLLAACGSSSSTATSTPATSNTAATSTPATSNTAATSTATATATDSTTAAAGAEIPDETAGPYPGDGTNGPNALTESGVVRQDIRAGFGSSTGVAEGIPSTVILTVVEADTGAPLPGAAVYLWHCDRDGRYSLYDIPDENYLRGVQTADDGGVITFTSIFPGCYAGRWPHAHFEVYSSLDEATVGTQAIKTSQLAYPETACNEAYATSGYETSVRNIAQTTLDGDNVFSDGYDDQLGAVSGSPNEGYTVSLVVRV